ncbi:MAG: hypothetical protein L3K02_07415, partial [Thermoplasmata archaeon]|nr:hypothetical protein [Thermoplasmata archaeon]
GGERSVRVTTTSPRAILLILALAAVCATMWVAMIPGTAAAPAHPGSTDPAIGSRSSTPTPGVTTSLGDLALGISTSPTAICAGDSPNCPAGTGLGKVALSASPASSAGLSWPAVQVAFVLETTPYDGVADSTTGEFGTDVCDANPNIYDPPCEESNGVPFFVANAQTIANVIQEANPHSQVSFALVDFFATYDDHWNDPDGAEYHVDIQQFVPAHSFGADVRATFQASVLGGGWIYSDSDMADNMLDSSSITALYGTIIGSGLTWSADTHHVIVYLGSTAPQDPAYPENYVASMSQEFFSNCPCVGAAAYSATCEPSYIFADGVQPQCEGWVHSQDGNPSDSIAALAHQAPECTGSVGGTCTIDVLDYNNCVTDPYCKSWPTGRGVNTGPGSLQVTSDADHILLAGCDLAAATGGSWNGPGWFTCPNGQSGNLQYVPHGLTNQPNTANSGLLQALRGIGFGPVSLTEVARGTGAPVFTFVPFGHIALAPTEELQATASCTRLGAPFPTCQKLPTVLNHNGLTFLAWNWSTVPTTNAMFVGDSWTASFNVVATGPPFSVVPVDACTTDDCKAAGSGQVDGGLFTWAHYLTSDNVTVAVQSFPLSEVSVETALVGVSVPPPLPSPPPPPPPPGIAVISPVAVPQQVGVGQSITVSNLSLQGIGAGVIAAGFARVGIKNKPLRVAVMSARMKASIAGDAAHRSPTYGRWQ